MKAHERLAQVIGSVAGPSGGIQARAAAAIAQESGLEFIQKGSVVEFAHDPRPAEIDTSDGKCGFFGSFELEISAAAIVTLCEKFGGWTTFSRYETIRTYRALHPREPNEMAFDLLRVLGYIVMIGPDKFRVTDEFVKQCTLQPI